MVARTLILTASYIHTLRRSAVILPLAILILCTLVTGCAETAPIIAAPAPDVAASHNCRVVAGSRGYEIARFYDTMVATIPALSSSRGDMQVRE